MSAVNLAAWYFCDFLGSFLVGTALCAIFGPEIEDFLDALVSRIRKACGLDRR